MNLKITIQLKPDSYWEHNSQLTMKKQLTTILMLLMLCTIATAQYVGIGTTTPGALLDVAGDALISGLTVGRGAGNLSSNTAFGNITLLSNATGTRNVAIGQGSLHYNTSGSFNVSVGSFSLWNNTTGMSNIAIGDNALNTNTSGLNNTAIGLNALVSNTTGMSNTIIGFNAGTSNITGSSNIFLGDEANAASGDLYNASAIGHRAYVAANNSMVLGSISGVNNAGMNTNVGIGTTTPQARLDVAADIRVNTLTIGRGSGNIVDNTAIGINALLLNTTGSRNVAMGLGSLESNTIGSFNVANGSFSLYNNTSGTYNIAIGDDAMNTNTTGGYNTGLGANALLYSSTGIENVALGFSSGSINVNGNRNTFLGTRANPTSGNLENASAIGNRAAVGASNAMVLGSILGVNGANASTNVGIGTTTPTARLDVAGTFNAASWKTVSLNPNGYAEMGGVLLQWGIANYNSNNVLTITFPKVFTNVYSVTATVDAGNNSGAGVNVPVKVLNIGNSTFQIAGTVAFSGDTVTKIRWMAVGN